MNLYRRIARVTVWRATPGSFGDPTTNGLAITDLRMQFAITKTLTKDPNTCDIVITNAKADTRAAIEKKPLRVRLEAGYDGELRHVFTGDLRFGSSILEQPDWSTRLQLGDGDRAYRHARASKSYKRGVSIITAVRDAAAAMGLVLPADVVASADLQEQFASGEVLQGPLRDELTRLLAPYGYHWSIQDGTLTILKDADATDRTLRVISQTTGMIGSPEFGSPDKSGKPPTLTIRCLLYPEITPGGKIRVESRSVNGMFKVERVTHTGDTHGDEWQTEIEAKPL